MDAIKALEDYKNKGERVDEVLFNIITKELHHLRTVIDQKNFSIDLIGEQKFKEQTENKRLREALEFYANPNTYKVDAVSQWGPIADIDKDSGGIARQALEGNQK